MHRSLRGLAIPWQRSVFLAFHTVTKLKQLLAQIDTLIDPSDDGVRAYPVDEPPALWLSRASAFNVGLAGAHSQRAQEDRP